MSTRFDLWWASRPTTLRPGEGGPLEEIAYRVAREAFGAGERMAAEGDKRLDRLAVIAGGVASSLLFNGSVSMATPKVAAAVAKTILENLERDA